MAASVPSVSTASPCPQCGVALPTLSDPRTWELVSDTEPLQLIALFDEQEAQASCSACGHTRGIERAFVVIHHSEALARASLAAIAAGPIRENAAAALGELLGVTLEVHESLSELRAATAAVLKRRLMPLKRFNGEMQRREVLEWAMRGWRDLTPEVFAAVVTATSGLLPGAGIIIAVPKPASNDDAIRAAMGTWGVYQSCGWYGLFDSHSREPEPRPFEEDLVSYVDRAALLPGSVDIFSGLLDELRRQQLTPLTRYCLEATWASVCVRDGQRNVHAARWAREYFHFESALELAAPPEQERMRHYQVSGARAIACLDHAAAWEVVQEIVAQSGSRSLASEDRAKLQNSLVAAARKAGHPDLVYDLMSTQLRRGLRSHRTVDDLIAWIDGSVLGEGWQRNDAIVLAQLLADPFIRAGQAEELEHLYRWMDAHGGDEESRADTLSWFGSACKDMRCPERFLSIAGSEPAEWETRAGARARLRLGIERSNALRLTGQLSAALAVIDGVESEISRLPDAAPIDVRVARRNKAILLRDTGSPDAALAILEGLVPITHGAERTESLDSLAVTYVRLGREDEALAAYDEALTHAVGVRPASVARLRAARAALLVNLGRLDSAAAALEDLPRELPRPAALAALAARVTLAANRHDAASNAQVAEADEALEAHVASAERDGDAQALLLGLALRAQFDQILDRPAAEASWRKHLESAVARGGAPPAASLVALARFAYRRGDVRSARELLVQVPGAMAAEIGAVADLGLAADATGALAGALDRLTRELLSAAGSEVQWQDVRLTAELKRDVIARSRLLARGAHTAPDVTFDLTDSGVARLRPDVGRIGVLEWFGVGPRLAGLVTSVDSARMVSTSLMEPPPTNLTELSLHLRARLTAWTRRRSGSPFDLPTWRLVEAWFVAQVSRSLDDGDHLVILEHTHNVGIPWHVAASARWSCSYAASWSSLPAFRGLPPVPPPGHVGLFSVPRFRESSSVLEAFARSAERTRRTCASAGSRFSQVGGEAGDASALRSMLTSVDHAKLLCHGLIDELGEVALVVAAGGRLPPKGSIALDTVKDHRLSWRSCQDLERAPAVVMSAACSSGTARLRGLGERLGIFGALRAAGARALVAPQWDVVAEDVLPVIDDAFDRYVAGGEPLAHAVHAAAAAAASRLPTWLAWSIAVEGDWR